MRGKKTDIETKAKIIEERINTFWSSRDIEQSTGIPHETVAKVLRDDFAQVCTESEKVAELIDRNNRLQSLWDKCIEWMVIDWESVKLSELVALRNSTFNQNQLLWGKATERIDIWDYSTKSQKELEEIRRSQLI